MSDVTIGPRGHRPEATAVPPGYLPPTMTTYMRGWAGMDERSRTQLFDWFAQRYQRPIFEYLRVVLRKLTGSDQSDTAEELRQEFFMQKIFSGVVFERYDPSRGRFRDFIKKIMWNFVKSRLRIPPPDPPPPPDEDIRDPVLSGPGGGIDDQCARERIRLVMARLRDHCRASRQETHHAMFLERFFPRDGVVAAYADLADRYGLLERERARGFDDEKARTESSKKARSRVETVKGKFLVIYRDLVAEECEDPAEIDRIIWSDLELYAEIES